MANEIQELRNDIAASIYMCPCDMSELMERDFLKTRSEYGIEMMISQLEQRDALYYKGEKMHINKNWAKQNLHAYDLDFRSKKEIRESGMTDFAKQLKKRGLI